jgi:branched-chain amino acid transport system permease protein
MSARAWTAPLAAALVAMLASALAPRWLDAGQLRLASEILLALGMAQMWNLLAGYTGLLSLGHQLFVALGAYALFEATQRLQIAPTWALPLAGLAGAAMAALLAPLLFRLRDAYFAIGLWVFAEIGALLVSKSAWLGGSSGRTLDMGQVPALEAFQAISFWQSSAIGLGLWATVWALMRGRLGLALLTVRDNELAARSLGVDVWRVRFVAFVLSGAGCGLAGGAYYMGAMLVSPDSAFDINWVVMMMFATLIGGMGTLVGPALGVALWFALRELLSTGLGWSGGWYLMAMGTVAVLMSLTAPQGLWGLWQRRQARRAPG